MPLWTSESEAYRNVSAGRACGLPVQQGRVGTALLGGVLMVLAGCGQPAEPPKKPLPPAAPIETAPAPAEAPPVGANAEPAEMPPTAKDGGESAGGETPAADKPAAAVEVPGPDAPAAATEEPKAPEPLAVEKRDTLAGRWILVLSQGGMDFYVWLVDVTLTEGQPPEAKLVATSRAVGASILKEVKVDGDKLELAFMSDDVPFVFNGRLDNGLVRGAVLVNNDRLEPARCEPSKVKTMAAFDRPKPAAGQAELMGAMEKASNGGDLPKLVKAFADKFEASPLRIDALGLLVDQTASGDFKDEHLKDAIELYRGAAARWDERLGAEAAINAASVLAEKKTMPDYAMELLAGAEKALGEGTFANWRSRIEFRRGQLLIVQGKTDEGIAALTAIRNKDPLNAQILYILGNALVDAGRKEDALPLFAELSVLPMMERAIMQQLAQASGGQLDRTKLPSVMLKTLWTEVKGSEDGLEAFLDKLYAERLVSFAEERRPARAADAGTRVALFELFTGAECPPCVGADVAAAGIEKTFAPTEAIVLRYHQHIPGPDPLVNPHSQQRFEQYQGEGTPYLALNGKPFEGAGGFMAEAAPLYKQMLGQVEETLKEKIGVTLELSAKAEGGKITASAKAAGIEFPETTRLYVVVAEDKVDYRAGNGIRHHEMVVRAMPAGVEGVKPAEGGVLAWEGAVDLNTLKEDLLNYLQNFEAENGEELRGKPLEMKALQLVVFLQDTKSREVLQAAAIPVSGSLETTFNPEEAMKAAPKKKVQKLDLE
jgi:predicted negative regulator of RcsB-dependent stress response